MTYDTGEGGLGVESGLTHSHVKVGLGRHDKAGEEDAGG